MFGKKMPVVTLFSLLVACSVFEAILGSRPRSVNHTYATCHWCLNTTTLNNYKSYLMRSTTRNFSGKIKPSFALKDAK
jgi:hypothetical protein